MILGPLLAVTVCLVALMFAFNSYVSGRKGMPRTVVALPTVMVAIAGALYAMAMPLGIISGLLAAVCSVLLVIAASTVIPYWLAVSRRFDGVFNRLDRYLDYRYGTNLEDYHYGTRD